MYTVERRVSNVNLNLPRGQTSIDGAGLGTEKPAGLSKDDDEYDAFRKRMMLAYRFRPNPLVGSTSLAQV